LVPDHRLPKNLKEAGTNLLAVEIVTSIPLKVSSGSSLKI
jgi:hypothetical protein